MSKCLYVIIMNKVFSMDSLEAFKFVREDGIENIVLTHVVLYLAMFYVS